MRPCCAIDIQWRMLAMEPQIDTPHLSHGDFRAAQAKSHSSKLAYDSRAVPFDDAPLLCEYSCKRMSRLVYTMTCQSQKVQGSRQHRRHQTTVNFHGIRDSRVLDTEY